MKRTYNLYLTVTVETGRPSKKEVREWVEAVIEYGLDYGNEDGRKWQIDVAKEVVPQAGSSIPLIGVT